MQASSVLVVARTQSRIGDVGIVGLLNSAWNAFENRIQQKQITVYSTIRTSEPTRIWWYSVYVRSSFFRRPEANTLVTHTAKNGLG